MSTPIYTCNYRRNLELFWQQYYPGWAIPAGYHVHHIKPKSTFTDKLNPRIHHPSNLIALCPDDHVAIHRCRGDVRFSESFILSIAGAKKSRAFKENCSKRMSGTGNNNYGNKHTADAKCRTGKASSLRNRGKGNPMSKSWQIIDPANNKYIIRGTLSQFADEHNLVAWTLANIAKTGKIPFRGTCAGWYCEYI